MGVDKQIKESKGSITVFLSLILLIILSLIMTIIEGARINTARAFAERALTTAMDSVLAEFYAPLMEEYHLLGLEAGYGGCTVNVAEMENKLQNYMSYTFQPNQGLDYSRDGIDLYDISVDSLTVKNSTSLMDYQGDLFINEAVEYMKYEELGNGMELLLDKMSLLKEPEKVSVLYEEKLKVEEELVAIDEGILTLMKLYDGVGTTKNGLKVNKDGTLQTLPDYIKRILYGTVTAEKAGINNNSIFDVIKGNYIDPAGYFKAIEEEFNLLESTLLRMTSLDSEMGITRRMITDAQATLTELEGKLSEVKKDKTAAKEVKAEIKACEEYLGELDTQLSGLETERTTCEQEKQTCMEKILLHKNEISLLTQTLEPLIMDAETAIDSILSSAEKADPLIEGYEASLDNAKQELGEEIYSGLEEGLKELKRYQSGNPAGYDFPAMKQILEQDYSILISVDSLLANVETELAGEEYQTARESFEEAGNTLTAYRIDGLTLDYSTLVIQKENDADYLGMIGDLMKVGLTGLVLDPDTISDKELTNELLPTDIAALSYQDSTDFDFTAFFGDLAIGGKNSGLNGLFEKFGNYDVSTLIGNGVDLAAEHILFQTYLQEHFYRFPMEGEATSGRKPSALAYEQEYLLLGNASDKENITSFVTRLIFLRTILNFTSLLKDKAKWNEARTFATALVGFTGLPVLVAITQSILVVLLAFSEALVDTCALLMGKEVQLLKNKVNLNYTELLGLQRDTIRAKASTYPDEAGSLSITYSDYLKVFLFLKNKKDTAYRCMDLIQENIRVRYEDTFAIQNCLFGFETEAGFSIKPKFTGISFVKQYLNGYEGTEYTLTAGCSY
jgi:hypothetical protein